MWHAGLDFVAAACGLLAAACGLLAVACMRDLVPGPGIEPGPPALGEWSLTHWTAREVPRLFFFKIIYLFIYLFIFGCVGSSLLHTGFL